MKRTNRKTTRRSRPKSSTLHIRITEEMRLKLELKADAMQRELSDVARSAFDAFLVAGV